MLLLVLGLVLFLGVHSTRIVADGWRTAMVRRLGDGAWKGLYSVVSIAGFALIVWGYGLARQDPTVLWGMPPVWVRHIAALLTLIAFVLLVAAYVPGNGIKAKLHHPMVLGVKVWAFAHLVANNTLADLLLFGGFLLWAVLDFRSARRRDAAAGTVYAPGSAARTAITVVVGVVAWAAFAFWLHGAWIGVAPMGRAV
jgi:uncharacterized membrane protein